MLHLSELSETVERQQTPTPEKSNSTVPKAVYNGANDTISHKADFQYLIRYISLTDQPHS
jgi:hypothetical protein